MVRVRARSLALVALVAVSSLGCQLPPNFDTSYEVDASRLRERPLDARLAVRRFVDERPDRVWSTSGKLFLTYIPLLPYVEMPFERLDDSIALVSVPIERHGQGFTRGTYLMPAPDVETFTYPASFARAITADLAASGLFRECTYVGEESVEGFDYVLEGVVRKSPLRRTATSFGLGMAGVLLWFLPVPMAKTTAGIEVDLSLVDAATGERVWERRLDGELSRLITLYTSSAMVYGRAGAFSFNLEPPPADSGVNRRSLFGWHFAALRKAMLEARPDLAGALPEQVERPATGSSELDLID